MAVFLTDFSTKCYDTNTTDKSSRWLTRGGIFDKPLFMTLLMIHQKLWETKSLKNLDKILYFINISKFGTFKNHSGRITSLNMALDTDLFCQYKQMNHFVWAMAAAKSAANPGKEWNFHTGFSPRGISSFILVISISKSIIKLLGFI